MYFLRSCKRRSTRTVMLLSTLIALFIVASGSEPPTPVPPPTPAPTVIKLADAGWETLSINNAITKFIIENGYGFDVNILASSDWQKDLSDGTVDVIMEGWEQNYREWYKQVSEAGTVKPLGTIFENGP